MAPQAPKYLIDAKPTRFEDGRLYVAFDPEFETSFEAIQLGRNPAAVRKVLGEELHQAVQVHFEMLDASETLPGDSKFDPSEESPSDTEPSPSPKRKHRTRQEWLKDPIVRKTLEAFDGVISDIRE